MRAAWAPMPPAIGPGRRWADRLMFASASAALAVTSGVALAALMPSEAPGTDFFGREPDRIFRILWLLCGIFCAPFLETALLAVALYLLRRFVPASVAVVIVAGALTCLHRFDGAINWVVFPGFVVFASVYLIRGKPPHEDGFITCALTHAIANLVPFTVISLGPHSPWG